MSGIAGILRFDGAPHELPLLERMTGRMAHRGPDGIRHWVRGPAALGQCMLRTTPESLEETQPLANDSGTLVLVLDGRVDNADSLRRELAGAGARVRGRSDAELVLKAYETWPRDCLARIEGDFALAIWDTRRNTLFCARDAMGIKPFYYAWNGATLAFASEMPPLLDLPWVSSKTNEGMLAELLVAEPHTLDETVWSGVRRLPAAHSMTVSAAGPRIERYWHPRLDAVLPCRGEDEFAQYYRSVFAESVRRACRSHLRVAADVSGGLDSSAIFCMAAELQDRQRLPAPAVEGFTMSFPSDSDANELGFARDAGVHARRAVREVQCALPPLGWYTGRAQAFADFPCFPNAALSLGVREAAAASGCRVALTGEGGDALLDGSPAYYAEELHGRRWGNLLACLADDARALGPLHATRLLMRHGLVPLLPQKLRRGARWLAGGSAAKESTWLSQHMHRVLAERRVTARERASNPGLPAKRAMLDAIEDPFAAQVMCVFEREGARQGLELRHPFLSLPMIELSFALPERLRLRAGQHKHLHRRAMQGLLPASILQRESKAEFSHAFVAHLAEARERAARFARERPDLLDVGGTDALLRKFDDAAAVTSEMWPLWGILGTAALLSEHDS